MKIDAEDLPETALDPETALNLKIRSISRRADMLATQKARRRTTMIRILITALLCGGLIAITAYHDHEQCEASK